MSKDTMNDDISQAVESGGYLHIGHGGAFLHYTSRESGYAATLSGIHPDEYKAAAIAAGLPVIDACPADFKHLCRVSIGGPMIAPPGREPDPEPYTSLSYARWPMSPRAIVR